jgi:hypothetical protein
LTVAKGAAERGDVDAQIPVFDERIRPDPADKFVLADDIAGSLDQDNQQFKRTASDADLIVAAQQQTLGRQQPEWTEGDRTIRISPLGHAEPRVVSKSRRREPYVDTCPLSIALQQRRLRLNRALNRGL